MRRLALLLICAVSLFAAHRRPVPVDSVLIKHVTVIDATGAPARPAQNVLTAGDRIVSITSAAPRVSKRCHVIDGTGKFLIPGLWDMHVHLWEKYNFFPFYLANGIIGVRDMGSDLKRTLAWRKEPLAPRVYTSGPAFDGRASEEPKLPIVVVNTTTAAANEVNRVDDEGADFIKILSGVSPEVYDAIAYRARILRTTFAGHLPPGVSAWHAVDERQRSIEHLFGMLIACSSDEAELREAMNSAKNRDEAVKVQQKIQETYDEGRALELFRRCARFGVYQTPTITMLARMSMIGVQAMTNDPRLEYVPPSVRATWKDPAEGYDKLSDDDREQMVKVFNRLVALVKVAKAAGAPLLAGTDTGDPYALPGYVLHDELKALVTAGLTPMEALQTATLNPARFFNAEKTAGTVERGKVADLVLLDADPLANIENTRRVRAVVLRGKLLTRQRLDEMLAGYKRLK